MDKQCMFCDERPEEAEWDGEAGGYAHVDCMDRYLAEANGNEEL